MAIISFTMLSFLSSLLLLIIFTSQLANAENNTQNFHYFCNFNNRSGTYTPNSTYKTNLNTLLSTLTSDTEINYGFYNFSQGENTNKVNAIGLCRGDVGPSDCHSCLNGSRANLTQLCPNQKEAIGWFEDERCMLRYSDRSIFGVMEDGPAYFAWSSNNATKEDEFDKVVNKLLDSLRSNATSGDTRIKYATAKAVGPNNETIYGLVQCTPDLSKPQCDDCLVQSIKQIPICCNNSIGARVVRPSCNVRYETNSHFYEPTADSDSPSSSPLPAPLSPSPSLSPVPSLPSPPLAQNTSSEDKGNKTKNVVAKVSLLLILLCSFLSVSI